MKLWEQKTGKMLLFLVHDVFTAHVVQVGDLDHGRPNQQQLRGAIMSTWFNISEMSPASCWIFAMTNQRSSEGFNPGKVYLMSVYSRKQVSMRMSSSVNREQDREVYQSKIPPKTTCIFKLMFISSHSFLFYTRTLEYATSVGALLLETELPGGTHPRD